LTPYIARVQHLLSRDDDLRVHTTPASEAVPPTASVAEATAAPISEAISEAISTATSEATSSTRSPRPQPPIAASSFATPKPISAHVRAEIAEIAVANEEAETARSQRLEAALTEAATARAEVEALRAEKHAARMEAEAACTEAEAAEAAASAGCAEAEAALEQVEAAWTETEAAQADAAASRREAEAARMEAAAERVISLVENKPQVVGLVRERFREADTSGNGALDVQEAVQLVGTLCGEVGLAPPRDDKVATLLAMCDKSGDGELQLDEFEKFFAVVLRDAHKKAARTDQAEVGAKLAGMEEMEKMQPEISKAKIDAALVSKAKEVAQVTVLLHQSQSHAKALEAKAKQEKIGLRDALSRALARATEAEAKAGKAKAQKVAQKEAHREAQEAARRREETSSSEHQAALQEAQRCVQIASEAVAKMEASEHSTHEALWRADMAEGAAVVAQAEASRLRAALAEAHSRGEVAEAQAVESTQQRQALEDALVEARASFARHAPHRIPHRRSQSLGSEIGSPALVPGVEVQFESPSYSGPATQAAVSPSYSGPARRAAH